MVNGNACPGHVSWLEPTMAMCMGLDGGQCETACHTLDESAGITHIPRHNAYAA